MGLENIALMATLFSVAVAIGGGMYEFIVLNPQWSKAPPTSFGLIQPDTGVPLQKFWIPTHSAITLTLFVALAVNWGIPPRRLWILMGLTSYFIMRGWSFAYFIPEMIRLQKIPVTEAPSAALTARVERWTRLSYLREPLDLFFFFALMRALSLPL